MRRTLLLVVAMTGLLLLACSDDDPVMPGGFSVTVSVVDPAGTPAEGILVNMLSDNPYLQDKGDKRKAKTAIQFTVLTESHARLVIEDIEGAMIRELLDDDFMAGVHQIYWDGHDDGGIHQHSGRYTAHLVVTQHGTGAVLFEDSTDMLMCLMDPTKAPVGQTDASGRLTLTDKQLFPQLYDRPAMEARDESGQVIGLLETTAEMIFTMADTANGGSMIFRREVDGQSMLEFVWDPAPKRAEQVCGEDRPVIMAPPNDEPAWRLGPAFPSPFN